MSNPNTADEALVTMLPMQRIHLVTASLGFRPPSLRGLHSFNLYTHTCHFHSLTQHEFNNCSNICCSAAHRSSFFTRRISQKLPSTQSTTPVEPTRLRESRSLANPSLSHATSWWWFASSCSKASCRGWARGTACGGAACRSRRTPAPWWSSWKNKLNY